MINKALLDKVIKTRIDGTDETKGLIATVEALVPEMSAEMESNLREKLTKGLEKYFNEIDETYSPRLNTLQKRFKPTRDKKYNDQIVEEAMELNEAVNKTELETSYAIIHEWELEWFGDIVEESDDLSV